MIYHYYHISTQGFLPLWMVKHIFAEHTHTASHSLFSLLLTYFYIILRHVWHIVLYNAYCCMHCKTRVMCTCLWLLFSQYPPWLLLLSPLSRCVYWMSGPVPFMSQISGSFSNYTLAAHCWEWHDASSLSSCLLLSVYACVMHERKGVHVCV